MSAKSYIEKLRDPRWQKVRLEVLQRDEWMCVSCQDHEQTLHVHHGFYMKNRDPWDYPLETLHTLCETCHSQAEQLRLEINCCLGLFPPDCMAYLPEVLLKLLETVGPHKAGLLFSLLIRGINDDEFSAKVELVITSLMERLRK